MFDSTAGRNFRDAIAQPLHHSTLPGPTLIFELAERCRGTFDSAVNDRLGDLHGEDSTKAACRAVSDAIRHSSLPLLREIRERGGEMLVDVVIGVPNPSSVDIDQVKRELPHGVVSVRAEDGGLRVPGSDTLIACAAITVSARYPD